MCTVRERTTHREKGSGLLLMADDEITKNNLYYLFLYVLIGRGGYVGIHLLYRYYNIGYIYTVYICLYLIKVLVAVDQKGEKYIKN